MPLLHVIKHVAHKRIHISCHNSCLKMPMYYPLLKRIWVTCTQYRQYLTLVMVVEKNT